MRRSRQGLRRRRRRKRRRSSVPNQCLTKSPSSITSLNVIEVKTALIMHNLLKGLAEYQNPAYRLIRHFSISYRYLAPNSPKTRHAFTPSLFFISWLLTKLTVCATVIKTIKSTSVVRARGLRADVATTRALVPRSIPRFDDALPKFRPHASESVRAFRNAISPVNDGCGCLLKLGGCPCL